VSAFYTPRMLRATGHRLAVVLSMAIMGVSLIALPFLGAHLSGALHVATFTVGSGLVAAVLVYCIMGCCRALGGVAISTSMMESVPKHFMGRVQNTFYFAGTLLQLGVSVLVGSVAHKYSLAAGFAMVGSLYLLACVAGAWPARDPVQSDVRDEATVGG
jgi:MFS family permease